MMVQETTRAARRKSSAEIFTPDVLVNEMLDKLPKSVWRKGKTFLDPAAGNGNFLVRILIRKIERGHKPLEALRTIYGVDLMPDNVKECQARLLKIISTFEEITKDHIKAVLTNIVCANSLEYDFEFAATPTKAMINQWFRAKEWNAITENN